MELKLHSDKKYEMIDITAQVSEAVRSANVAEGVCCVFVPHATAAVIINENDDMQIAQDLLDALDKMVPEGIWRHDKFDNNAAAHLKASILSLMYARRSFDFNGQRPVVQEKIYLSSCAGSPVADIQLRRAIGAISEEFHE